MTEKGKNYSWQADTIIIRRTDILKVHNYARQHCCLRDYLLIRLPMKIGLRTGEICSFRIENINFQEKTFHVLDSKRKRFYPLPLDALTLQLIHDLIGNRFKGYVFTRELRSQSWSHVKAGKPLHVATVEKRIEKISEAAGVKGLTPRLLRHYFAVEWHRQGGSLELLRRILRHKSLAYTQFYLSRLVYFEDLQSEYEKLQNGPLSRVSEQLGSLDTGCLTQKICHSCANLPICKLADQMPIWATGCQHYKKEVKIENAS
jgi:integrase